MSIQNERQQIKDDAIVRFHQDRNAPDWMKKITDKELEQLGAIGYKVEQLAMYFNVPKAEFMYYYSLADSPIRYYYERGKLVQQAKEGFNMADAAASGDNATQAQRFDKLRRAVKFQNEVNEIFFGDVQV